MLSFAASHAPRVLHGTLRNRACTWAALRPLSSATARADTEGGSGDDARSHFSRLPSSARAVVIGGGVIGCSVAYHLAKMGMRDVHLLEQAQLTAGTTWHAAGLINTYGSTSETSTELRKYTRELYKQLEEETGQSTGFKEVGFIELASTPDRLREFRRVAASNRFRGIEVHELTPAEVQERFPLCRVDDIEAGFFVPDNGRANPVDVSMALAKGARMHGAAIHERVEVVDVLRDTSGLVRGVVTEEGHEISSDYVVNCTGMWARQLGGRSGVLLSNQAAEHYYLVTEPMEDVDPSWPVIEDAASYTYIRPEAGGLMVGMFEPVAAAWNVEGIPRHFEFGEIEPDWERMSPFLEKAMNRVPRTLEVGARTFFCGPESFTPDLMPIIGEAPELRNYFVAAGMNSVGILSGGGVGRLVAQWIVDGKPDMDVTAINANRVQPYQCTPAYRAERVVEALGLVFKCHYPYFQPETARGAKRTPIYSYHQEDRACFGDISGWEAPLWFAEADQEPTLHPHTWERPHWFKNWKAEHDACRESAVVFDMSFMAKFMVQGRDAARELSRLCTREIVSGMEHIAYTQMLNDSGKLEADVTVVPMGRDEFMVIGTDTMHGHLRSWMKRNITDGAYVSIHDVSGGQGFLSIQGPNSRAVMERLTGEQMDNASWPFLHSRRVSVGFASVVCSRISYVGELGYEMYVPAEHMGDVYERVRHVGREFGMRAAGLSALGSLRMEKAYRDYGHDMDNTDSLLEVGLGFTCDWEKEGGFIGMEAVQRERLHKGPNRRLVQVLLEDPTKDLFHAEVVHCDGKAVGDVRAASYGHTLGGAVGLCMVDAGVRVTNKFLREREWSVDVDGVSVPARVSLRPLLDPTNEFTRV